MKTNNSRRDFLKKTSALVLGGIAASAMGNKVQAATEFLYKTANDTDGKFTLPELPYAYDALEPHIDKLTMEIHHSKHHQGYVNNLNKAIEGLDKSLVQGDVTLKNLFSNMDKLPDALRNNAGGHYNHTLFWTLMQPKGETAPNGKLAEAINNSFGSFDEFKKLFAEAAMKRFGSGWAWLIKQDGKLLITSTANQDNPLMNLASVEQKGTPVLALDVWEHAYYLKNQNRRADYIASWWKVVNWETAESLFNP